MALFDIPGWSVSAPPVAESSQQVSKKRKRPASDSDKLQSAEVNLEKLVKRLKGKGTDTKSVGKGKGKEKADKKKEVKQAKKSKAQRAADAESEAKKKTISRPMPLKAIDKDSITSERPAKRQRTKLAVAEASSTPSPVKKVDGGSTDGLTALQKGMKQSLDGARFRCVVYDLPSSA